MTDDDMAYVLGVLRSRDWVDGFCAAIQLAKECCDRPVKAGPQHMIRERIADRIHETALAAGREPRP
jgi:hypothetical protein